MAIFHRGQMLGEALAPGLVSNGWLPDLVGRGAPYLAGSREPVVFVEDDLGGLPDAAVQSAVRMAGNGERAVVAVAGLRALAGLVRIVAAGATAVNADQPYRSMLAAVHLALAAGPHPSLGHGRLLADLRQRAAEAARFHTLTDRECAVLAGLAAGRSAESIAASRPVGLSTVRSQIAAVLRKLGVRSQAAAIALTHRSCADRRITEPLGRFHQNYG